MKLKQFVPIFIILYLVSCKSTTVKESDNADAGNTKKYSVLMGNTVLNRHPDLWSIEGGTSPRWTYTYGLVSLAMLKLSDHTSDNDYYEFAKAYADSLIDDNGIIRGYKMRDYNIDKINSGKILFRFYDDTKDERYKTAMDTLRKQLAKHPRTEIGGFWHKNRYPHQMWLDGLYMGAPFYAQYAAEFNEPESFDEITKWYINMESVALDETTGLLYHGWDESKQQEWADKETGCSQHFWGRGMGWYAMALVDVLDYLPEDHKDYNEIVAIINRMATAILKYQDEETGTWYQVVDQGNREGNYLEGSASAMFSYFLLKAVNKGYIDKSTYLDAGKKAFEGTVDHLVKTDSIQMLTITPVCAVAGLGGDPYRDGSYEYYINEAKRDNDPKAVGPFIMAAIEYESIKQ